MITPARLLIFLLAVTSATAALADSTLDYTIFDKPGQAGRSQPVLVKEGRIVVRGAGGDSNMDMIYARQSDSLQIIDHKKRAYMTLDQQQIGQFSQQAEQLQPLLQGFGEQLGKLSPQQKAKWQQMLGDTVSIDDIASAANANDEANLVKTGLGKHIAGIPCEQVNVLQGQSKTGELCIADPIRLNLSVDDYETVRSLLHFSESLATKTQGLAKQFGFKIPSFKLHDFAGVPIEMRDLSKKNSNSLTLSRILTTEISAEAMRVPAGYRQAPLTAWR